MLVLCDIDGTLADCRHRKRLLLNGKMDWSHFLSPALVAQDPLIVPVANLIYSLPDTDNYVIFVTGRHEGLREVTTTWLTHNYLLSPEDSYDGLRMRKHDDFRPDHVIKEEILDQIITEMGGPPNLVIDDRPSVLEMWRRRDIFTLAAPTDMTE